MIHLSRAQMVTAGQTGGAFLPDWVAEDVKYVFIRIQEMKLQTAASFLLSFTGRPNHVRVVNSTNRPITGMTSGAGHVIGLETHLSLFRFFL